MIDDIILDERRSFNKIIARSIQRQMGFSKLSEAYEFLALKAGFKDWNTACARSVDFRNFVDLSLLGIKFK